MSKDLENAGCPFFNWQEKDLEECREKKRCTSKCDADKYTCCARCRSLKECELIENVDFGLAREVARQFVIGYTRDGKK